MFRLSDAAAGNEFWRFLAAPFGLIVFVIGMAAAIVPIATDRSKHQPGNFAPIQLISAVGAWALILLNQAVLVSSLWRGSPILACASVATILTTLWLFFRRTDGRIVDRQAPQTIEAMICEMEEILGGALRVGIASVDAVIVEKTGPLVCVSVSRRGHVVVRLRQELMAWMERHRRPGGAGSAAVEGFLRFTILHEIGHVLNGDHLTYRFVRSVLLAHLCWVAVAAIAAALLPWGVPAAQTALVTTLCLGLPFVGQCLLARRFLAEREETADLRAMQTLDPSDASLLGTRSGRRTDRQNPTLLEKLMTDLHVLRPVTHARWPSKAVQWVWPEAGNINARCERLALGREGRMPQPNQWAAFMGMQCGLLYIALLGSASAAFGSLPSWRPGIVFRVAVILMEVTCSIAATYCGMRVDPALVRLHDLHKVPTRRTVCAIFYFSFTASALLLYLLPAFSGISTMLSYPLISLSVGMSAAPVIFGSCMAAAVAGGNPENAAISLRHPMMGTVPVLLITLGIAICCSAAAAWGFGLGRVGSRVWIDVWIVAFAGATTTYFMSRSTSAVVRAVPPIAWLDASGRVFAIRIFWHDIYFDRHITSHRTMILLGLSTYAGTALMFACGGAFAARLMSGIATDYVIHEMLMLMSAVLAGLMSLVPRRTAKTADLTDLEHLRMLDHLLTAVRTARLSVAEVERLTGSMDEPQHKHSLLRPTRARGDLEAGIASTAGSDGASNWGGEDRREMASRDRQCSAANRHARRGLCQWFATIACLHRFGRANHRRSRLGRGDSAGTNPRLDRRWTRALPKRRGGILSRSCDIGLPVARREWPRTFRSRADVDTKRHDRRAPPRRSDHPVATLRDRAVHRAAGGRGGARPAGEHRSHTNVGGVAIESGERHFPPPGLLSRGRIAG